MLKYLDALTRVATSLEESLLHLASSPLFWKHFCFDCTMNTMNISHMHKRCLNLFQSKASKCWNTIVNY